MVVISNIFNSRFFKIGFGIILILVIFILIQQVSFFIRAFRIITSLFIIPMLLGGFLYYLLRPMVNILNKYLKFKTLSIIISFGFIITIIIIVFYFGGNIITEQTRNLINQLSDYYYSEASVPTEDSPLLKIGTQIMEYLEQFNIQERLSTFLENMVDVVRNNIFGIFTTLTNIGTVIILIPFVVYYLLKDDHSMKTAFLSYVPTEKRHHLERIMKKIDNTLSQYITGQVLVAFILGILTYIGFKIIGLPNALILAAIVMITSFVPFLGPLIGTLPAVFMGISHSFIMVFQIILVLIIVQQIESNIIQPKVQGVRLKIHPLVVIFMVLIFITLFGFIGALYAVPAYAVARVLFLEYHGRYIMTEKQNE